MSELIVGLTVGAVYSLIAIGFSLTYRSIGLLNFAHPEFVMLGAVAGFSLSTLGLPFFAIIPLTALAGAVAALVVDLLSMQWIVRRRSSPSNGIIATLGWSSVLAGLALIIWGPDPLSYHLAPGSVLARNFTLAGATVSMENVAIFVMGVVLMGLFQWLLKRTRLGMALRASADDPEAASLCGIRLSRMQMWTFALSGALGGIAGAFIGLLFLASYNLGDFALRAFAPAVLGGFGDVVGAMVGGLAFGIIITLSASWLGNGYQDLVSYALVILVLLFRPAGLLGTRRREA